MKLYRIGVEEERVVAPSARQAVLSVSEDDHEQKEAQDVLTVWELAEPEATLHLTLEEIAVLTHHITTHTLPYNVVQQRIKAKLDNSRWQIAAQRTMLEKAQ